MYAHGKYDANTMFEIDIFKNRVVFYNPGYFPHGLTPNDFINGKEQPIKRNPKINDVLFKTNVIEAFGTGFERAFTACDNVGIGYSWEENRTGFRMIFQRIMQKNAKRMTQTEEAVLNLIDKGQFQSALETSKVLGKSLKTIQRALKVLQNQGKIKHIGPRSTGRWIAL